GCLTFAQQPGESAASQSSLPAPPKINFVDIAARAGLVAKTVAGNEKIKRYIIKTTGSGVAFFDYDNDGWPDVFLVNGSTLAGFPKGQEPTSHLYHNNRDGTFTDVTKKAGVAHTGWGQGVCAGDYDNDGWDDLFVTYWGECVLWRNNGNGTFTNVAKKAGVTTNPGNGKQRWNTGCAFLDYDKDGHLDLFVANDSSSSALYKNNHDGTFTDIALEAGVAFSADGKPQAGMGVAAIDYDGDGNLDIVKTNFAGDTTSLYRNLGKMTFDDQTFQ